MITRGHFIGEIVDALSDIKGQVSTRGKLGLTDLNRYLEDFFKVILNHLWTLSLENLNAERSNFPGLDLADKAKGWAFQVTAEKTTKKVNETLEKITEQQIKDFQHIKVLVIGVKQGSYTLDPDQCARMGFTEADIWDVDDLCKRCMDLEADVLQTLYSHIRSEVMRVRIELELPDTEGNFPTSVLKYIEEVPRPRMSDWAAYRKFVADEGLGEFAIEAEDDFRKLSAALVKLPRITREFLAVMIERRETESRRRFGGSDQMEINADRLARISSYPDTEGELRLLETYAFIYFDEPTERQESGYWRIGFPEVSDHFEDMFVDYVEKKSIPLTRPLVSLDFSDF